MQYTLHYTHTPTLEVYPLSDKVGPAIPKNIRFPQDLYELIQKKCDKERKTFTDIVIERLILTFVEDWDYTGNLIRLANRERAKWDEFKIQQKKIRLKEIFKRKLVKMESEAKRKQKEDEESMRDFQNDIDDMKRIREHLEGKTAIWVNKTDPSDWIVGDVQSDPEYRKLPKGELTPELQKFYDRNQGLLK